MAQAAAGRRKERDMEDELEVQSILAGARQAGLPLTEEEAAELVKGVARLHEMAAGLRELLSDTVEPAPVFAPRQEGAS
jgi:hypothetical protein